MVLKPRPEDSLAKASSDSTERKSFFDNEALSVRRTANSPPQHTAVTVYKYRGIDPRLPQVLLLTRNSPPPLLSPALSSIPEMLVSTIAAIALFAASADAHFRLNYPEPRGAFVAANEVNFCGGYPLLVDEGSASDLVHVKAATIMQ